MSQFIMPKIHLLFFDAGGGHRSAATALQASAGASHPDWQIESVNIGKLLEPLDFFHKYVGIAGEDIYNKILQHGLTLGAVGMLRATQNIVRLNRRGIRKLMTEYWQRTKPDLVVSLVPNFNLPLFQALAVACPETAYMTVMTDIADLPAAFLDGKAGAIHRLRQQASCRSGAGRLRALPGFRSVRDDFTAALL